MLARRCIDAQCPADQTCTERGCENPFVGPDKLKEAEPEKEVENPIEFPPSAPQINVSPAQATTINHLECKVTQASSSLNGGEVTHEFSWSQAGGTSLGIISSARLDAFNTTKDQTWICTVVGKEGDLLSVAATASVTIQNSAPEVGAVTLAVTPAGPLDETKRVSCDHAPGTDADGDGDGDELTHSYLWYRDTDLIDGANNDYLDGSSFDYQDRISCVVTPDDGTEFGESQTSNTLQVSNSAPTIAGVRISPVSGTATSTFTCHTRGWMDADNHGEDVNRHRYEWFVNDVSTGMAAVGQGSLNARSWSVSGGDAIACAITPSDGIDLGTSVRSATITVGNTPPTIASVALRSNPAYTNSDLAVQINEPEDLDGDMLSYFYTWEVLDANRVQSFTSSTPSSSFDILSGNHFHRGYEVKVIVTPFDGISHGTTVSATIGISNSAPTVSAVTPHILDSTGGVALPRALGGTLAATVERSLRCVASGWQDADREDENNPNYNYYWLVNNVPKTPDQDLAPNNFSRSDRVRCKAEPYDIGGGVGDWVYSSTLTIQNALPIEPIITVTPNVKYRNQNLGCLGISEDPDLGDNTLTYDYTWRSQGPVQAFSQLAEGVEATLTSTHTQPGEVWTCTASAFDGRDYGPAADLSVGIDPLVAWWKLDADAIEYFGNHSGTFTGVPARVSDRHSNPGGALSFDGSNSVEIPGHSELSDFEAMTVCAWIKAGFTNAYSLKYILGNGDIIGLTPQQYTLHVQGDRLGFSVKTTQSSAMATARASAFGLRPEEWGHLCGVYDGNNLRVYVNGMLGDEQALSGSISTNSTELRIGTCVGAGCSNLGFVGEIDDVKLWMRGLNNAEICDESGGGTCLDWVYSSDVDLEFTRSEITVKQFEACVMATACSTTTFSTSAASSCNYGDLTLNAAHPMNCVDKTGAEQFCAWSNARLPASFEWEGEATNSGEYPWGDSPDPNCSLAVMHDRAAHLNPGCGTSRTATVCSRPLGNSVSGLCDMSGNVKEWTASAGTAGTFTLKGGDFDDDDSSALSPDGGVDLPPTSNDPTIGFRCVRDYWGCAPGQKYAVDCWPIVPNRETDCYNDTTVISCPGTADRAQCANLAYCGQAAQYDDANLQFFTCRDAVGVPFDCAASSPASSGETVTDDLTRLMWQRADILELRTWAEAMQDCDDLVTGGYDDWRLPTPHELRSIVDRANNSTMSIHLLVFPSSTTQTLYWTKAEFATDSSGQGSSPLSTQAWHVDFSNNFKVDTSVKTSRTDKAVRCVRGID